MPVEAWAEPSPPASKAPTARAARCCPASCSRPKSFALTLPQIAAVYFIIGVAFFSSTCTTMDDNGDKHLWTFVDSLYFSIVTITTTGYGDLLPDTDGAKIFACFYAYIGVGLIAAVVGILLGQLMEAQQEGKLLARVRAKANELRRRSSALAAPVVGAVAPLARRMSSSTLGQGVAASHRAARTGSRHLAAKARACAGTSRGFASTLLSVVFRDHHNLPWSHIKAFMLLLGVKLVGILYMMYNDTQLSATDAAYLASVTITSVGYGDFSPTNQNARIFGIFWIMCGTMLMGRVTGNFVDDYFKYRQALMNARTLRKEFTLADFRRLDKNHDGVVDELEYFTHMVVKLGYVKSSELHELRARFAEIDSSGDGIITREDLEMLSHMCMDKEDLKADVDEVVHASRTTLADDTQ